MMIINAIVIKQEKIKSVYIITVLKNAIKAVNKKQICVLCRKEPMVDSVRYEDREFKIECNKCRGLLIYKAEDIQNKEIEARRIVNNRDAHTIPIHEFDYVIENKSREIICCPICSTEHIISETTTVIERKPYKELDF
jgi:hypothetical protein